MEEEMIKNNIPLYALESGDPVSDFDFIGLHCSMSLVLQMCSICLSFLVCLLNPVSVRV
mgnify:CR=1 FL=1